MKTTAAIRPTRRTASVYPNAADTSYFLEKFLDILLMAAISVGVVAILIFLLVLA